MRALVERLVTRRGRERDRQAVGEVAQQRDLVVDRRLSGGEAEEGKPGEPSFERLSGLARGVTQALRRTIEKEKPLYLILEGDVAQTLGAILKEEWGVRSEVLVIDGVGLRDFDYIDLGRIRMPSCTVPVTIKSLVFSQDPRG